MPLLVNRMSVKADACASALGEFGWWQLRAILLVALVKVPSAWQMASILFTAPSPGEFWCARPSELLSWDSQQWREYIHPNTSAGNRDACNIYDVGTETISELRWIPGNMSIRPCEQFEFREGIVTVVTQWNLVCQREVLVSVSQFFYLLGILVGGVLCTQLLKRFSPKRILLMGMITQIIAGIAVAQAPQFELHVSLRFLTAVACANMFTSGYVICTDITAGRWRLITGACYEHMWSAGVVTLAGLGYFLSNWIHLQLAISIPTVIILLAFKWIPDSPRWLIEKGHGAEAKRILEEGTAYNRRGVPMADIQALPKDGKKTQISWFKLFQNPTERWNCLALHIIWAATVVTYYGALLNIKNVGEHLYFNTTVAGFAEVLGVLLGLTLILWCSQKWVALGGILVMGGGMCIVSWALPTEGNWSHEWAMLGLAMMDRIAIASSLTLLQVTSSELLPQEHQQLGIFSSIIFARICLLSAPFIGSLAMYGKGMSLSAFGGLTFMGGLAAMYLGWTRSKPPHSEQNTDIQNICSAETCAKCNRQSNAPSGLIYEPPLPLQNFPETTTEHHKSNPVKTTALAAKCAMDVW